MRFSSPQANRRVPTDMTPMIDVVFQLLVFFLFTFKITPVEGEIGVNMPPITAGSAVAQEESTFEHVLIRLNAGVDGGLEEVRLGDNVLGGGEAGLRALSELLKDSFGGPGGAISDVEVEIDAERTLRYYWVIRSTNAVMYAGISRIDFTDPKLTP